MKTKLLALVTAAAVTTGLGGFGTYSNFASEKTLKDDVNITMGTFDVKTQWGGNPNAWVAKLATTEVKNTQADTLSFENVKPGDIFERNVIILNNGSLDANVTRVMVNPSIGSNLQVSIEPLKGNPNFTIKEEKDGVYSIEKLQGGKGHFAEFKLTVKVLGGTSGDKFNLDAASFVTVNSEQIK